MSVCDQPPRLRTLFCHLKSIAAVAEVDLFREFMAKRNRIAHGANEVLDPAMIAKLLPAIKSFLMEGAKAAWFRQMMSQRYRGQ